MKFLSGSHWHDSVLKLYLKPQLYVILHTHRQSLLSHCLLSFSLQLFLSWSLMHTQVQRSASNRCQGLHFFGTHAHEQAVWLLITTRWSSLWCWCTVTRTLMFSSLATAQYPIPEKKNACSNIQLTINKNNLVILMPRSKYIASFWIVTLSHAKRNEKRCVTDCDRAVTELLTINVSVLTFELKATIEKNLGRGQKPLLAVLWERERGRGELGKG